jgi:hypothetical protein
MEVCIGIDWSENKHDTIFMNQAGAGIARKLERNHAWPGLESPRRFGVLRGVT